MVQPLPQRFYALTAEKRPPEGAVGRCQAARSAPCCRAKKEERLVPHYEWH